MIDTPAAHRPSGVRGRLRSRRPSRDEATAFVAAHWLPVAAVVAGWVARITFWQVTDRKFEDGLITVTHAQSVIEGIGLTHHAGEPHVQHGFTSALSVLVPLAGELVKHGSGITTLRLASLVAFAFAVVYAYRLSRDLGLGAWPTGFVLAYLAFDQNSIFYGIAGMETQMAVAILLAAIFYVHRGRPVPAGLALGLCVLVRPDFLLFVGPALAYLFWRNRSVALRAGGYAALLTAPWIIFTLVYYGSPVPATIEAKAYRYVELPSLGDGPIKWVDFAIDRVSAQDNLWHIATPFLENGFIFRTPFSTWMLGNVAFVVFVLAIAGGWMLRRRPSLWPAVAFVVLFLAYKILLLPAEYYEWYLPPLMSVIMLLVGVALQRLRSAFLRTSIALAAFLGLAFSIYMPFTFPIEHRIQSHIEDKVRMQMGYWLRTHVKPGEAVASESAGYVGYYGRVKLYDYPGLTSPTVLEAFAKHKDHRSLPGIIDLLHPEWAILRPAESDVFKQVYPRAAARYVPVQGFDVPESETQLLHWGVDYINVDRHFIVLRRRE
jgi:hypothetical protein